MTLKRKSRVDAGFVVGAAGFSRRDAFGGTRDLFEDPAFSSYVVRETSLRDKRASPPL